ncbi:FMN-binding protein [Micromonospora sp. WMMD1082]|uniref:FMN-binding protein n=1 Tax=Micromonospora sp. WMMD1082 TaxID=3016104 RepID=UPI002415CE2F|nr:FMN-binding protein [Micromonospora sp. WMMD1082]MDG4796380.1 FMN-binding protein [Micromonospora sp. WMMD1082]
MRRALLAITGLAASTTALVVLKAAPGTSQTAQEVSGPVAPASGEPDDDDAPVSGEPDASASPKSSPSASARKTPSAGRSTSAAPRATTRTVTGPAVSNEFGSVQVRITLAGNRIVNAVAVDLPRKTAQSDQRSDQVDSRYSGAAGMVVERQSADLDTVSGATATSESYRGSLQAAIDQSR